MVYDMKSMLVIDGSECIARLFAEIFERRGWSVATCSDRDSAIERLTGNDPYDVILLGYRRPGTTGVQLVRLMRSLEHRMTTAVVIVTGKEVAEEALAAGADEILLKPINPNTLTWVVDKLVT
jgi:CheY-like chemotaxis protein